MKIFISFHFSGGSSFARGFFKGVFTLFVCFDGIIISFFFILQKNYSKTEFHHFRYQRRKKTMQKNIIFAKKIYIQNKDVSKFGMERARSVKTWFIHARKYIKILSVHGCSHHFLKVGKNATKSIIIERITV